MNKLSSQGILLVAVLVSSGCAVPARVVAPTSAAEVGEFRHGFLNGYLPPSDLPDSLALIPAPPTPGSAAQADDDAAFHELTKFQGTARGALAVEDANLSFPDAAETSHARSEFQYRKRKRRT
jgi:acid phosphatase (class A)